MAPNKMNRPDWTLLAIAAAGNSGMSPVQLQKTLFIIGQKNRKCVGRHFYNFVPYNYGPFDPKIYRDADELAEQGFVSVERTGSVRRYSITAPGKEQATNIREAAPSEAVDYLDRVVTWAKQLSFEQLVSSIYKLYPEFKVNSVFRG